LKHRFFYCSASNIIFYFASPLSLSLSLLVAFDDSPVLSEETGGNLSQFLSLRRRRECFFSAAAHLCFTYQIHFGGTAASTLSRARRYGNKLFLRETHSISCVEMRVQYVGCFLYPRSAFVSAQKFLFSYIKKRRCFMSAAGNARIFRSPGSTLMRSRVSGSRRRADRDVFLGIDAKSMMDCFPTHLIRK
jgi:hypothetical protein